MIRTVVTRSRSGEDYEEIMVRIREEIEAIKRDERKRLKPILIEAICMGPMTDIKNKLNEILE